VPQAEVHLRVVRLAFDSFRPTSEKLRGPRSER
jgi:hypothetical protein